MAVLSTGLLMFATSPSGKLYVFLIHPGGPFYQTKDLGAWSIPKGLLEAGEEPLQGARREFREETGLEAEGDYLELGEIRQKSGKIVKVWAFEKKGFDPETERLEIKSNLFRQEWPPKSGQMQAFPEADRGEFFDLETAYRKILPAQAEFLTRLAARLTRHS